MFKSENLPPVAQYDLEQMVLGRYIGSGASRRVFEYGIDPKQVVKVEYDEESQFQNVLEWDVWQAVRETKWAGWFAPCYQISPNGRILLQARTGPIYSVPDRVPSFLADLKIENFGTFNGQVVAHDYGLHLIKEKGLTNAKLKNADWWSIGEWSCES